MTNPNINLSISSDCLNSGYLSPTAARASNSNFPILIAILAAIYGVTLSQIPGEDFIDFVNYIRYAENSFLLLIGNFQQGIAVTLFNEPVWLLVNAALALYLEPEAVIRIIIFLSAVATSWLVLKNNPRYLVISVLFLMLPAVIKNNLIHLRQGLAIAVFLLGWYSPVIVRKWFLFILASLIHSSFLFILSLLIASKIMQHLRLGSVIRVLGFVALGIILGFGLEWLATTLGARQANEYGFSANEVSGAGFVVWGGLALVWIAEGRVFLKKYDFETGIILFYIGTYWFIEVTGRIFESGLIFVLIAGLALTQWRRLLFLSIVIGFGGLQWLVRIVQPGMGFMS